MTDMLYVKNIAIIAEGLMSASISRRAVNPMPISTAEAIQKTLLGGKRDPESIVKGTGEKLDQRRKMFNE